jgi:molybdopterin/thiamine biosynthesis adenylyltransferase
MNSRLVSQSFLGPESDAIFAKCEVGIVGLGGGGSHLVQQLAHLGVGNFAPVDHDVVEEKNLNRLVGATADDAKLGRAKTEVAERVIRAINPLANVTPRRMKWQEAVTTLRRCGVIFGCVDSYRERDELERFSRRFLIPYIDLGMDVHEVEGGFSISGQTVLSSPGGPCLRCLGIVTDDRIAREAERYGAAGSRPQVVWANGVLASLAVGLFVQLVCPWHNSPVIAACCEFDGNRHRVETSRVDHAGEIRCGHFNSDELGDAFFGRGT